MVRKATTVGRANGEASAGASAVTTAFVDHCSFLRKFLKRYFVEQQDIEDVAQEAYLRAFVAEREQRIERPKAFLFHIAKNLALTELSRKSRQITDRIGDLGEDSALSRVMRSDTTPEDLVEAHQQLGAYCQAVAALPEQCRRVYLLRKVHGLPHREIAERLGMSVSGVEKHLANGILKCREQLRGEASVRPAPQRRARQATSVEEA